MKSLNTLKKNRPVRMNKKLSIKFTGIILIMLTLCACNTIQQVKEDNSNIDMVEIERMAKAAYDSGDLAESEKNYTILSRQVPRDPIIWYRLGNIYAHTQRPDAAVAAYRETLIRDPQFIKAWYNMGIIQLKQAAKSFNEMKSHTNPEHPLNKRSEQIFEGILDIIKVDDATP